MDPEPSIVDARDALVEAGSALRTHRDSAPATTEAKETSLSPDELRGLATLLDNPEPATDLSPSRSSRPCGSNMSVSSRLSRRIAEQEVRQTRNQEEQAAYDQLSLEYARELEVFQNRTREYESAVRLQAETAAARLALPRTPQRSNSAWRPLAGAGLAGCVAGGVMFASNPPLGAVLVVLGLIGILAGIALKMTAANSVASQQAISESETVEPLRPPVGPTPPTLPTFTQSVSLSRPSPDPRIARIEFDLASQHKAVEDHHKRRSTAIELMRAEKLPVSADELRTLARELEAAAATRDRLEAFESLSLKLEDAQRRAAINLAVALGQSNEPPSDASDEAWISSLLSEYSDYLRSCRVRAEQAKAASRRPDLEAAYARRLEMDATYANAIADRAATEHALLEFVSTLEAAPESARGSDAEAAIWLRIWITEQEQLRADTSAQQEVRGRLDQLLAGRELTEWEAEVASLAAAAEPEPAVIHDNLDEVQAELSERHERLVRTTGDLRGQQTQLEDGLGSVAAALEEEASAERALEDTAELARCIDTARTYLEQAKARAHANIAPALEATLRPWIPRVTGGRYLDVGINAADLSMKVTESSGALRDARFLSQGTTEQLYLLLRVALAQHLGSVAEVAPLVMDDVTVQSDQTRTVAILDLLLDLSTERQVILFSQEQEVIDWANASLTAPQHSILDLSLSL